MGPIGMQEMMAVFVIALVLFGPKKLPELGRMLGKGLSEFRRAKSELKATFESHLNELERETQLSAIPAASAPDYSSPHYSYPYEDAGTYETGSSPALVPPENFPLAPPSLEAATDENLGNPNLADPKLADPTPHALPVAGTVPRGSGTLPEEHSA
jgi:TatA/E family protein of Tat protein translocase